MTYLYDIGISRGQRLPISTAIDADSDSIGELLTAEGFQHYVETDKPLADLAAESIRRTLESSATNAEDVDAIFLITESFWDNEIPKYTDQFDSTISLRHSLLGMMSDVGLSHAQPYGVWMSACANFGAALGLANSVVSTGHHHNALIVAADKLAPEVPRLMHNNAAVWSDISASCLIGSEARGFKIRESITVSAPKVASFNFLNRSELPKILSATIRAVKRLDAAFEKRVGRPVREFEFIVVNHFHRQSLRILTDILKIPGERLRRDALADYAHGYAADNMLTLSKLESDQDVPSGQEIVLFNSSIWTWSLSLVEKVEVTKD
ncbi:MAG: hypothetical protein R3C60_02290 [Parvularculaceae bacterium]